jgi:hypothetical protein
MPVNYEPLPSGRGIFDSSRNIPHPGILYTVFYVDMVLSVLVKFLVASTLAYRQVVVTPGTTGMTL